MIQKILQKFLILSLFAAVAQATPISYVLTFNGVAVGLFPAPLSGDSYSVSATQYFGHFITPQDLNTTDTTTQAELNLNAGPDATGTSSVNFNQGVTISSLSGVTLANAATQNLAWTVQDTVAGSSHTFSVLNPLPSVQFFFTDGTVLTVAATSAPSHTFPSTTVNGFNDITYSLTYGTVTPEPATFGIAACGLLALVVAARRRV